MVQLPETNHKKNGVNWILPAFLSLQKKVFISFTPFVYVIQNPRPCKECGCNPQDPPLASTGGTELRDANPG